MKDKLFDYVERDNVIFNLSGVTKLLAFLFLTFGSMYAYDIRIGILILIFSFWVMHVAEIKFSQVRLMMYYVIIFLVLNFILTFVFDPQYAVNLFGTKHVLFAFNERYTVTAEQLLYQVTKTLKYASVVPLGMLFLLTTNPSEFAASLHGMKVSYKAAYALSLTLRYFPDMVRDYNDIALAQQSRGLDLSRKEKLGTRIKNTVNICVPLIFSTLTRIDVITNAMELRGFGKHKSRTWYSKKPFQKADYAVIVFSIGVFVAILAFSNLHNHGRFWNPFVYGM
jgi:energy-coupling factor transport system permease protein